jgi:hypothetical protein
LLKLDYYLALRYNIYYANENQVSDKKAIVENKEKEKK